MGGDHEALVAAEADADAQPGHGSGGYVDTLLAASCAICEARCTRKPTKKLGLGTWLNAESCLPTTLQLCAAHDKDRDAMLNQALAADQAARKADKSAEADLKDYMLKMEKSDPDEFKRLLLDM